MSEAPDRWQDQEHLVEGSSFRGDCFRACVAGVLSLPIAGVPHFVQLPPDQWWLFFCSWCSERGFSPLAIPYAKLPADEAFPPVICIANGPSPRGDGTRRHSVVWRGEQMIHDPHPSRSGLLGEPDTLVVFVPLDVGVLEPR